MNSASSWIVLLLLALSCRPKATSSEASRDSEHEPSMAGDSLKADETEQVIIDRVEIRLADGSEVLGRFSEQMAQRFGRRLAGSGFFFALANETDPMKAARRARFVVRITHSVDRGSTASRHDSHGVIRAAVEASAEWTDGGREEFLTERLLTERTVERAELDSLEFVVVAHVAQTVEDAADGLISRERLRGAASPEVLSVLQSQSATPSEKAYAVELAQKRQLRNATSLIGKLLASEHPMVRDAAMAALVEFRDPRTVDVLIAAAKPSDTSMMVALIEALTVFDGPDVHDYLEFVASGHPDEEIRGRARQALKAITVRQSSPGSLP